MDAAQIGALTSAIVAALAPYLAKAGEEIAKETGKVAMTQFRPSVYRQHWRLTA